jgi:N-acyl-D-aspartate/D-glutamate deacylase
VVFDPGTVIDAATFDDPCRHPEGISWVLVNGDIVAEYGRHTGRLAGAVLTPR